MQTKVLSIAVALLLMVQGAWAQDATLIDGVYYVLNNEEKTAEVVEPSGFRYQGDIVVPDTVKQDGTDYAVTSLGEGAFMQSTLTSVQLPKKTLRVIGPYAFLECEGLTTVDIPETVTTIGTAAFAAYDLTHMHIPASVTEMGRGGVGECPALESITVAEGNMHFAVFDGVLMDKAQTRLICYPAKMAGKTYTVPTTVTKIDGRAFEYLAFLTSVTLPASVTEITYRMFYQASSLAEINIDPANTAYCSADGVVYTADKDTLLIYPAGKTTKFYTPDFPVKAIDISAFTHATHLQTVAIPEGVATIRESAFYSCTSLREVSFPESITTIELAAFGQCESLESVVLPPNITEVTTTLLFGCKSLRSVTIPASVTNIGLTPFVKCPSLTEITCLTTTPPTLNAMAFVSMKLGDITLYVPEEAVETYKATPTWKDFNVQPVTKIAHFKIGDLYYNLDLQDKTAQVTWQFFNSFDNYKSQTAVTVPAAVSYEGQELSVTEIGKQAFAGCTTGITSVSIPEGIVCINDSAFYACEVLADVNFPNSIERIGTQAFMFGRALKDVTFGSSLKTIGDDAFMGCLSITTLTIPDNVEYIGTRAFSSCKGLKTVTIGSGATSIGSDAFTSCISLEEMTVSPENPAYCSADGVLFNKDKTTLLNYPAAKTGDYVVPGSVTEIGLRAFYDCEGLTAITLPEGLITIGQANFGHCIGLKEVVIPNSVTSIGTTAFSLCTGLTKLTIGSGVTTIGEMSFVSCTALTTIYNYAVTPQEIDFYTFLQVPTAACTLYVPEESVELYKAAPVWKNFEVKAIAGTGISLTPNPSPKGEGSDYWYDMSGRKLDGKPNTKGVFIHGGRKVVLK
jgi:hypothetical protein